MRCMSVILDVFQLPTFWLKDSALTNMYCIVVTWDVSQPEISELKERAE